MTRIERLKRLGADLGAKTLGVAGAVFLMLADVMYGWAMALAWRADRPFLDVHDDGRDDEEGER